MLREKRCACGPSLIPARQHVLVNGLDCGEELAGEHVARHVMRMRVLPAPPVAVRQDVGDARRAGRAGLRAAALDDIRCPPASITSTLPVASPCVELVERRCHRTGPHPAGGSGPAPGR